MNEITRLTTREEIAQARARMRNEISLQGLRSDGNPLCKIASRLDAALGEALEHIRSQHTLVQRERAEVDILRALNGEEKE